VNAITQARDGYLWLGVVNVLVRFDGARFTTIGTAEQFNQSQIVTLYEDRHGALWIGTSGGGLTRYHQGRFTNYTTQKGLAHNLVSAFAEDGAGQLWIGTKAGLLRWTDGQFITLTSKNGLPHDQILSLRADEQGALWIATAGGGLCQYRNEKFIHLPSEDVGGHLTLLALTNRAKRVWQARDDTLHLRLEGWRVVLLNARDSSVVARRAVWVARQTSDGAIWLGTYDGGLLRLEDGRFSAYSRKDALADDAVRALYEDREHNLWVGTMAGGLHRLTPKKLTTYGTEAGLRTEAITSVCEDGQGGLWVANGDSGLAHWRDGRFTPFTADSSLEHIYVGTVLWSRKGTLWVGSHRGGVMQFSEQKPASQLRRGDGLPINYVRLLFEARDGTLWVGAPDGLSHVQTGQTTTYTSTQGLAGQVSALAQDRDDSLWIGTVSAGLQHLKDGRFTRRTVQDGLPSDSIRALHLDREGVLWIGTKDRGLSRFANGRFCNFSSKNGLSDDTIGQILEDDFGWFYLGSSRGIIRLRRQDLNRFADGKASEYNGVLLGRAEGMDSPMCSSEYSPGCVKSRDGTLWFTTHKGLVQLKPERFRSSASAPPVFVEELVLDGEVVTDTATAVLKPNADFSRQATGAISVARYVVPPGKVNLEFRYTALDFAAPERIRFEYQLEGYDQGWTKAGARRSAHYTRVPPGQYRFRVKAWNNQGAVDEAGGAAWLVVQPHYWQTWWFRALALLAVAGAGVLAYHRRVTNLERRRLAQEAFSRQLIESQETERQRIAAELHDSLGQNLLLIKNRAALGLAQVAQPAGVEEQLQNISNAATQAISEVRAIAFALRPYELDRLGLTKAVESMVQKVAETSRVHFATDLDDLAGALSPEEEINLYRIMQEAINNVLKHAGATEVILELKKEPPGLRVSVLDDGRGFDPSARRETAAGQGGFGLSGMAERARLLGGELRVQSAPGRGTRVTVTVPLKSL
jgi:signal transduction histidine kinase/ligand-binding sensor domain-containing protein